MRKTIWMIALASSLGVLSAHADDITIRRLPAASAGVQLATIRNAQRQAAFARRAIFSNYRIYEACLQNANSEDIIALEAPTFWERDTGGATLDHATSNRELRLMMDRVTKINAARVRVNRIEIQNTSALVLVTQYFDAQITGDDGKSHRVTVNNVSRDIWIPLDGEWKIARSEAVSSNIKRDGKLIG